eukprot:1010079-Prymnesium_polylepis.1
MQGKRLYPDLGPSEGAFPTSLPVATPVGPSGAGVPSPSLPVPPLQAFDVKLPAGKRPGQVFSVQTLDGRMHAMTVPHGTTPGQTLSVIVLPDGYFPGQ